MDENYNLLKYMYKARNNKGNIRFKYINEMIVTIGLIEYLISVLLEVNNKSKNKCLKTISILTDIKNMTYAWKGSYEKENK